MFGGLGSSLSAWKASVKTRFSNYIKDKNLILATYLDPRFKITFLEYNGLKVEEAIELWLSENNTIDDSKSQATDSSDDQSGGENSEFNFSFESYFAKLKKEGGANAKTKQGKKGKRKRESEK